MGRQRSPNRDKAFEIFKEHNGKIENREIAKLLNENEKVVAVWKARDKWNDQLGNVVQQKKKSCTTNKKSPKKSKKNDNKDMPELNSDLTDKQELFCIYYGKYFNATKAALKAGYSKDTARFIASENLTKPNIVSEINRLKASKFKGAFLEKEDILQKYIDIAFSDITDYVEFGQVEVPVMTMYGPLKNEDGEIVMKKINSIRFKEGTEVDGTIISEVKQGRDGASIKLQDKMKALEFLSKHSGLLGVETQHKLKMEEENLKLAKERLEIDRNKSGAGTNDDVTIEVNIAGDDDAED